VYLTKSTKKKIKKAKIKKQQKSKRVQDSRFFKAQFDSFQMEKAIACTIQLWFTLEVARHERNVRVVQDDWNNRSPFIELHHKASALL